MASRSSKGILKKPRRKPPSVTSNSSNSSWLARIQSRFYASTDFHTVPALTRQELKRVTFAVCDFKTEHILDDLREQVDHSNGDQRIAKDDDDFGELYKQACRLVEEPPLECFMNLLQQSFPRYSQLSVVDLSGQSIGATQMEPIANILAVSPNLKNIKLARCGLDDESARVLLHDLLLYDHVTELCLEDNPFKSQGFKYIAIFINHSHSIKKLDISHCMIDKKGMHYLSHAIHTSPSLERLHMDHCSLKPSLIEILAGGARQSASLRHLSIRHNRITPKGAPWLAAMLVSDEPIEVYWQSRAYVRRGIRILDLTGNELQGAITSLAQALAGNKTLTHLILSQCQLHAEDCTTLADALLHNRHLQVLDISGNHMLKNSDQGIQAFKCALSRNHFLRELNLSNTDLDSSAAIALAECLPENSTLLRLDLSQNPRITLAGVLALSISVKMNHTLTFLDINIPPDDDEIAQLQNQIVAICTRNMQQSYDIHSHGENEDRKEASLSSCIIPANNQQQQGAGVDSYVVDHASSCVLPVS